MALTTDQKVGLLKGFGRLFQAVVDGAALAQEKANQQKAASQPLTGLLPRTVSPAKPGCDVCSGKKK